MLKWQETLKIYNPNKNEKKNHYYSIYLHAIADVCRAAGKAIWSSWVPYGPFTSLPILCQILYGAGDSFRL